MKIASFTCYGETEDKNREVSLHRNVSRAYGLFTYTVTIEGYPALSQTVPEVSRAEEILRGWWGMAQKDWGASEIAW